VLKLQNRTINQSSFGNGGLMNEDEMSACLAICSDCVENKEMLGTQKLAG